MRFGTVTSVALCVIGAGLGVVGCSASGSGSFSSGAAATSPASPGSAAQASPGSAAQASPGSAAQAGTGTSAPASSQQAQAGTGAGKCQPANLSFTLGAKVGGTTQPTQVVELTNNGSSACTMEGFPGVDLVGAANSQQNYEWPMARSSSGYASVTLPPGRTAHFDLRYLPGASGGGSGSISVSKMVITPPNDYTQAEVTWSQDVLLQDGATHPGTYVTPVVSGS